MARDNLINTWMNINGVSERAMSELFTMLAAASVGTITDGNKSESRVMKDAQLSAARAGDVLWRNNVGAGMDASGRPIRWGLCNVSKKMNNRVKSSDLIGIKKLTITQEMVGKYIGQFYAREVKNSDWKYTDTDHERAQLNFINIVNHLGGDAAFLSGEL